MFDFKYQNTSEWSKHKINNDRNQDIYHWIPLNLFYINLNLKS